jgi:DNA modification methylase
VIAVNRIILGDTRVVMRELVANKFQAQVIVTSPPYWGLRSYDSKGQYGLERTWVRHVARMRNVFRLARQCLRPDGLLWLNYGDSYHTPRPAGGDYGKNSTLNGGKRSQAEFRRASRMVKAIDGVDGPNRRRQTGLKPKDLVGMPWRIALALQADGWWLRSDIIWHKTNPMPESITDRPTKSHEHIFMLAKAEHYYYDAKAIAQPVSRETHRRGPGNKSHSGAQAYVEGVEHHRTKGGLVAYAERQRKKHPTGWALGAGVSHDTVEHNTAKAGKRTMPKHNTSFDAAVKDLVDTRNVRDVWTMNTQAYPEAHFATFPEELVARCILASTKPGDIVFDPFMGSGTVGKVALDLGRQYLGIDLNPDYVRQAEARCTTTQGMAI